MDQDGMWAGLSGSGEALLFKPPRHVGPSPTPALVCQKGTAHREPISLALTWQGEGGRCQPGAPSLGQEPL